MEPIVITCILLGAALVLVLAVSITVFVVCRRRMCALTKSIDDFLLSGTLTPLSTQDNMFGHLQSGVCDLENRLLQEHSFTQKKAQENTEFISDISHQLKTPLAGLRLYCEMEQAAESGQYAEKELLLIEKMEKLIANVLKLEKIRSDAYEMHFKRCELSKTANEICAVMQPIFPGKQITVSGNASMRIDPEWFGEALGNVVKNACEHTDENGEISILIESGERSVSIRVQDNGGGVPEEELPLLFNRFHRAAAAVPTSAGIGLAITKAIVEKHHGIISAQNTKEGLGVTMCLPIIDANMKL